MKPQRRNSRPHSVDGSAMDENRHVLACRTKCIAARYSERCHEQPSGPMSCLRGQTNYTKQYCYTMGNNIQRTRAILSPV